MEAGPRDSTHGSETGVPAARQPADDAVPGPAGPPAPIAGPPAPEDTGPAEGPALDELPLDTQGPDDLGGLPEDTDPDGDEHELRPERRLRVWQIAPIAVLGVLGSLMFAFPLAFDFSDGAPTVAMLGLLICAATAGWTLMVARWVGYTWPGLPERGSGGRPDWRYVAGYACLAVVVAVLAVVRMARLR